MQELITITTDGQGSSVVSARELYAFLEVKSKFADWIKRRIIKYGFQEETDYVIIEGVFLKNENNPTGGRPEDDYALTLDMAKQLSMVENNDKGQEARRYFIDCERKATALLTTPVLPSATEQMMLQLMNQQTQLMAGQQAMLEQLRAEVETIRQTGHRPAPKSRRLPAATRPPHLSPPTPVRQQITRKVSDYCQRYEADFNEAYRYLYKRMFEVYGINVYSLRVGSEKTIDALERWGHLDRLLSLVLSELAYTEE